MTKIHDIAVNHLRPTQITVGMIEVNEKKKHLKDLADHPHHLKEFLTEHPIPVVGGPEEKYFVIDHHHLVLSCFCTWHASHRIIPFHIFSNRPK